MDRHETSRALEDFADHERGYHTATAPCHATDPTATLLGIFQIVPITGTRDRLAGALLLGGRMSDEVYSATESHRLSFTRQ